MFAEPRDLEFEGDPAEQFERRGVGRAGAANGQANAVNQLRHGPLAQGLQQGLIDNQSSGLSLAAPESLWLDFQKVNQAGVVFQHRLQSGEPGETNPELGKVHRPLTVQ